MAATVAMWAVIGLAGGIGLAQEPATPQPAGTQPATAPAPAPATATTSPAVMLEKGIYTEETVGDLDAAIKIYQQIVEDAKAARKCAAQAQYRLGMCYLKKRQSAKAVNCFNELIAAFSDQKELVAKAREQIAKAREGVSDAEVARIVGDVVTSISTMADGDPRIPPLLASLRELKEPAIVKELTKYFDSDKNTVRRAAIYVFWKGEFTDASPAVPGLVKLCSHEEDLTRGMAAIALGVMKADSAFDGLADMTGNDKSPFARRAAAYALGLLGKQEAKPILEKALKDPDQFVRNNAEAAMTMLAKAGATSPAPPRAIKTTPEALANDVDPSLDRLSVTFDQKMNDRNWSWVQWDKDKYPKTTGSASFDETKMTCSLPVKLDPGKVYWIEFNTPPFDSFMSESGQKASRYALLFATKSADGKPTPLPDDLVKRAIGINPADQDNVAGARSVAEEFLAALKAGDTSKALRLVTAASATGHQLSDFAKIPALSKVVITGDFEDANSALVITSDVLGDHGRKGPLLIRLVKQRGLWGVEDIDLESPEGALKKLQGFLTGADALAAPYAIAKAFVSALAKGDANSALKLVGKEFDERKKQELPQVAKGMDLSNSGPMMMALYSSSARMVFGPASVKSNGARSFLCLTLIQNAPGTEAWSVIDADFVDKQKSAESFMSAPSSQASTADKEARKAKLINWVEKFFSENYRDITARKTLQWGEPETTAAGNLAIRYKYLATIWNKDQVVINQRFTFTPEGKYVSAETIEKGPAPAEMTAAPSVVETTPVTFADDVDPSLDKITVTFDRPMMDKSWSWTGGGETYPESAGNISYDANRTTCTMPVKLQPGKVYWVGVNSPSHRNFKTPDRVPAKWYIILFATRSADGKPTPLPADMLKRAKAINAAAATQQAEPSEQVKRDAENLSAEGWALWNQRKLPEAEAKFQAAVAKDPTNANAWNGLGWAQMNQGKALNAKDAFEKAVAADPKLAGALNGLGWVAISQGKTEDAVEYWKKAIAAAPATTAALNGLAMTYANLGEFGKSIEAYQQWLKVEPENKDAKAGLEKAKQDDKALLAGAESWLGLLDRGEYVKAWEQAGLMLRTIVDDKDMFAKVTGAVRDELGKVKTRKLQSRQLMMRIPGLLGGPFQVLVYDTQFEKKHMNENVVMRKDHLNTWGVVGYTLAPYSMTMSGTVTMATANIKDVPKEATAAAEGWVDLVDSAKYAESWDAAAEMFQKYVTKQEWQRQVANARKPLGKFKSRKLLDACNVSTQPDGPVDKNALLFQFEAAYEGRDKAIETVRVIKGADGKWRVAGYFIR